jgi:transposase-like protein
MPGPYRRVPQELKDKILDAVKNDGIPVSQASREYGVSTPSIHAWLKKELENTP